MTIHRQRIVWAVDAEMENNALFNRTVKVLRAWTQGRRVDIEPVYILSPDQVRLPIEVFGEVHDELSTRGRARLERKLERLSLPGLLSLTVLVSAKYSLRSAVQELTTYARDAGADLVVASSHSKKGLSRVMHGSFAETLVLQTDVPVLFVSPKTKAPPAIRHILFPTDFSERSLDVFGRVVEIAKEKTAKLTLFHQVEYLKDFSSPAFSVESYKKLLAEDTDRRRRQLEALANQARAREVKASTLLDTSGISVVGSILESCRRVKADVIALAGEAGALRTAILGSTSRQLLRLISVPVWILHPAAKHDVLVERRRSYAS